MYPPSQPAPIPAPIQPMPPAMAPPSARPSLPERKPFEPPDRPDSEVLEEIRTNFDYATKAWADIRSEGQTDIRYVAGEPWKDKDKRAREDAGRPCLSLDELGQYVNQIINDVRQNKRGVKVTPIGAGATDKTAELRQNLIRQIEYRSNAQQAYTGMFEDAVQRSYGFCRIKPKYVSDTSFDQELLIEACENPDLVTPDPDALKPDGSGMKYLFNHESISIKQFKRDYPDASITDFTDELRSIAPDWIKGERLLIAEYWVCEYVRRQLLLIDKGPNQPPQPVFKEDLAVMPNQKAILKSRWVDVPYVCQYLTNGVELLAKKGEPKRTPWPGKSIPFVACYGKTLYVNSGAGTERRLLSMIRLARDPFMLYCYYRTCEAELVGMTPKTPFIGYEGQFRGHETDWQKAAHEPVAFLEAKPQTEATGAQVLPLPQRQPYDPPIQSLEMGAEAARRAIQSAMGTSPLPTQAQRQNEKSGKALRQIEESGQKGSYHFVDHYDAAITRVGAILDELLPHYYDAARDVTIREGNDEPKQVRINDPAHADGYLPVDDSPHDVTLSVGSAYASQREAANEFVDSVVGNVQLAQVVGPQKFAELVALSIKLKDIGPLGDQMANVISPAPSETGQPTPQQVQDMQGQMQQLQQQNQQLHQAMQTDQAKQQAQVTIKQMDIDFQREKLATESEVKIAVAELGAKVDRIALFLDERARVGVQAHEASVAAMGHAADANAQAQEHQHEAAMAAMGHANAAETAAQQPQPEAGA